MVRLAFGRAAKVVVALIIAAVATMPARAVEGAPGADTVTLETGGSSGITIRLAEDLASVVDDGATLRVLPVVGRGGVQNVADLTQMPGIGMAILQLDVLDYARTQNLFPDLDKLSYVARLNYVEFHLLARQDVATVADLAGKTVSVGQRLGNTAITAGQLFKLLNLSATLTNEQPDAALEELRRGEIDAVAFVGGKPAPLLRMLPPQGLHLLSIPLSPEVVGAYVPTRLTAADYPGLVPPGAPVDTVAVGTGLFVGPVTVDSDGYGKIASVVDTFFGQFQTLLAPGHHGKWAEVNLGAQIPGWRRFPPADNWLNRNASVVAAQDLRAIFTRFLDEQETATGDVQMLQERTDDLYDQFSHWRFAGLAPNSMMPAIGEPDEPEVGGTAATAPAAILAMTVPPPDKGAASPAVQPAVPATPDIAAALPPAPVEPGESGSSEHGSDAAALLPYVQVASLDSPEAAQTKWQQLQAKMPDLLGDRSPVIVKAEVGGRTYWRLRTAGFATIAEASEFCGRLHAAGSRCLAVLGSPVAE